MDGKRDGTQEGKQEGAHDSGHDGTHKSEVPIVRKFKPLTLLVSLGLFVFGGYLFYWFFWLGNSPPASYVIGAGAAILIGIFTLTRVKVDACKNCGEELVEGFWLFPLESRDQVISALESQKSENLLALVRNTSPPNPPAPGKLSYAAVDFETCPKCFSVGRFVAARRTYGRADGTRVQVTRIGGYKYFYGGDIAEAMREAQALGRGEPGLDDVTGAG